MHAPASPLTPIRDRWIVLDGLHLRSRLPADEAGTRGSMLLSRARSSGSSNVPLGVRRPNAAHGARD
ncbi:hypothetical protein AURDEDRAFT_114345 [Auricularia subglabra TFB-10046 SS5]|nr:hypothetical protein AURDEDRAFT_114345 [Auricularia subglabra TFB-10046 SS5]